MHIETLKIFCDVVDTASFSKAGTLNSMTQSAVSQQILSLERKLGRTLLERGRRQCCVTPEGEVLLKAAREILAIYDGLDERFNELANVVAGELHIAAVYSIGLHDLPPYLKEFRRTYPEVDVHVAYRRSAQVYAQVLAGEAHFGLVAYPAQRKGIHVEPFMDDELVLICHPGHPLALKGCVEPEAFREEKFIAFDPDLPTRQAIDRHFRELGVMLVHSLEFDNIETVKRAVEIEQGVSVVPLASVRSEVEGGTLKAVSLDPPLRRPIGILLKRNRPRTPAVREFLALLHHVTAKINPSRAAVPASSSDGAEPPSP
ncbi:MAG TPA: LysR family transcriptional regulator [Chthoniobacteraceae bacterium]|nr:LysR family transcriptional regulator [Chthoniobacteraceae bacterium]